MWLCIDAYIDVKETITVEEGDNNKNNTKALE